MSERDDAGALDPGDEEGECDEDLRAADKQVSYEDIDFRSDDRVHWKQTSENDTYWDLMHEFGLDGDEEQSRC